MKISDKPIDELRVYFDTNIGNLQSMYPGLKFQRLENEFKTYLEQHIDQNDATNLNIFCRLLAEGLPLEYINNQVFFFNHEFFVDMRVLIPRSETEILVEMVLKEIVERREKGSDMLSVADICTGSGVIILSIMLNSKTKIDGWATDLSPEAIQIAKINLDRFSSLMVPGSSLHYDVCDRLGSTEKKFDVIVSNPPYVKFPSDHLRVHEQVLKFEPTKAIFLPESTYESWFQDFFTQVYLHLNSAGIFLMEGSEIHLPQLYTLLKGYRFAKVELLRDYGGQWRFLRAQK